MKMMLRTIVLVGIVLVGDTMKAAETVYPVFPLGQIPAMNGKWNGGAWENIPEAIGFTSVSTGDVVSMRQTAFKMGRYGNDLYIAIKCDEPEPDKIKVDENNYRDGWYPDDNLEFFFSLDKSPKGLKQFVTNSRGARWANFTSPNAAEAWQSATYKGTNFWSVEIKIPFSQVGIPDDKKSNEFWFNLGRSANNNPDNERYSSFASVNDAFGDVQNFASLAFKKTPAPEELAHVRKSLNRLEGWRRDKLWKIGNVKEAFLVGRQVDDNVRQLLEVKRQAKKMIEGKNLDGASELFGQYEKQVAEIKLPTKRLIVQVRNRDASTRLYIDGKELHPDPSGEYSATIKEGVSVLAAECVSTGGSPAVRIGIEGMPETASRWKVLTNDEPGWKDGAFDDGKWLVPTVKEGSFLWAAEPAGKIFLRQLILWNNAYDGEQRCILPLVREWGISENSTETIFLALYTPTVLPWTDYVFQLDMPEAFTLLDMNKPSGIRGDEFVYQYNCTPEKVVKVPVEHGGKYNRYTIAYKNGAVPKPGSKVQANYCLLPVKLNKWNSDKKETCFYYSRQACGNITEIETKLPVRILPPINGRMLKKIRIQQYRSILVNEQWLSDQHLEEHIKAATTAGFNFWQDTGRQSDYLTKVRDLLVDANASFIAAANDDYIIWGNAGMKGALLNLLETRPEFKARYFNNDSSRYKREQNFCPWYATIGEGRGAFREAVKKDFKEKFFDLVPLADAAWQNNESQSWILAGMSEHETAQKGDGSYCFCDRCKKAFKEFAKLPAGKQLSDDEIFKNYYKQWAAFRSKLDGEVEGVATAVCRELGKRLYVYHGTCGHTFWEACKGKIDYAFPGLPGNAMADSRQQQFLDDSMEFFRAKVDLQRVVGQRFSFMGFNHSMEMPAGKGCPVLSEDGYVNAKSWKSQIVRLVASLHEGVDMQRSLEAVAGMFYYIGEATRLIAEYEDLFYEGKREDSLATSEQLKYPNLLVLTKGDERLVLLFNETDKPIKVELNNKALKKGQSASIFGDSENASWFGHWFGGSGTISDPERMSVTVNAGDVSAIHIK